MVEGYVVSLKRNLVIVRCAARSSAPRSIPWTTPTAAFVRPQVGYQIGHPERARRVRFRVGGPAGLLRLRSIRRPSQFEIAREIVRALTEAAHPGKEKLRRRRPQRAVSAGAPHRAGLHPGPRRLQRLHPCEVGLQTYAQRIIGLLIAAITPDDRQGEAPLLPRLNRYKPIGSTRERFTSKPSSRCK